MEQRVMEIVVPPKEQPAPAITLEVIGRCPECGAGHMQRVPLAELHEWMHARRVEDRIVCYQRFCACGDHAFLLEVSVEQMRAARDQLRKEASLASVLALSAC